jgi:hypothetical protein
MDRHLIKKKMLELQCVMTFFNEEAARRWKTFFCAMVEKTVSPYCFYVAMSIACEFQELSLYLMSLAIINSQ